MSNLFLAGDIYLTESFQYQDFTDTYFRHISSRYLGSKTTSAEYTFYKSGDKSFGKTAAADKNTWKVAIMNEAISTGSDIIAFPERTNLYIKYLVDQNGNLDELIKRKYDSVTDDKKILLYQTQRIFKSGETINVGLFDYREPSKQLPLDGNKTVFQGGFKYEPVTYHRNNNSKGDYANVYTVSATKATAAVNNVLITKFEVEEGLGNQQSGGGGGDNYIDNAGDQGQFGILYYKTTIRVDKFNTAINKAFTVIIRVFLEDNTYVDELFEFADNQSFVERIIYYSNVRATSIVGNKPIKVSISEIDWKSNAITFETDPLFFDYQPVVVQDSNNPRKFYFGVYNGSTLGGNASSYPYGGSGGGNGATQQSLLDIWYGDIYFVREEGTGALTSCAQPDDINNRCLPFDYEFKLAPGDIIRFYPVNGVVSVISFNIPVYEYTIVDVEEPIVTPNFISSPLYKQTTFTIDRDIDEAALLLNNNLISYSYFWVISRKLNDETNIVISHKKNPGKTSGGIIKNVNLDRNIDQKIGNIISDLKTTILS